MVTQVLGLLVSSASAGIRYTDMFRSKSAGLGSLENELYAGNRRRETMSESEMQAELERLNLWPPECHRTCAWRAPSLRQGKPWKGGSDVTKTETFRSSPEGSTPSRQRLASQPEVSLAWAEATLFVKRRQRMLKPCIWPRNHVIAGAFVVLGAGAASRRPLSARSSGSGRGLGAWQRYGMDCLGT
jgi:hypothetical protein